MLFFISIFILTFNGVNVSFVCFNFIELERTMTNIANFKDDDWDEVEIEILEEDDLEEDDDFDEFLEEIEYLYYDDDSDEELEEERVLH